MTLQAVSFYQLYVCTYINKHLSMESSIIAVIMQTADLFNVVLVPGAAKHFAHAQSCHVAGEALRQPPVIPGQHTSHYIHSQSHTVDVFTY